MDSDGSLTTILLIVTIVLLLIRAFYSACEHALIEVNDGKVKNKAEKNRKYQKLLDVISKPREILSTFSVHRVLSCILVSVFGLLSGGARIFDAFSDILNAYAALFLALITFSVILLLVMHIFTDVIPKRIAEKNIEKMALAMVIPYKILRVPMIPFEIISRGIIFLFGKIFGFSVNASDDVVTEEEILMMVEAGNETGVIEESQCEMINNIFEFDDAVVSDVMTHRMDIIGIDAEDKIGDVVYLAINEGFSRLPVYEGSVDNIIGILNVKDLLCLVGCEHSEDFNIKQFMRKAEFVPETAKCKDVLEEMTLKKTQMMVIADEYGGTSGIVTMEDLLEEIVGNIQDEYDDETAEISELEDGVLEFDGSADPDDVFSMFETELEEGHNYDTISAFIVDKLGRIPQQEENAELIYENILFRVVLVEDNWISRIRAEKIKGEQE